MRLRAAKNGEEAAEKALQEERLPAADATASIIGAACSEKEEEREKYTKNHKATRR